MTVESSKLSSTERVGYAMGDAAANLVWRGALAFLAIFYTDAVGLSTAAVAALLLVVRLSDGVTDIIMGMLADRTDTRWGKFRPWILVSAPILGLFMVLTFTTIDMSPGAKLAYAYFTYIGLTLAYTMNNVPYSALMGVMTPSSNERAILSSWRFAGAFFGGLLVMVGTPKLVEVFGEASGKVGNAAELAGYQYTMYLFAALLVALLFITFFTTKERIKLKTTEKTDWGKFAIVAVVMTIPLGSISFFFYSLIQYVSASVSGLDNDAVATARTLLMISGTIFALVITATVLGIKKLKRKPRELLSTEEQDCIDLVSNTPWVIMLGVGFLFMMFNGIKIGAAVYYFEHYLADGVSISHVFSWWPTSIIQLEGSNSLLSAYFFLLLAISVIAALATSVMVKFVGKRNLFIASLVLGGLTTSAIYFTGPEDVAQLFTLGIVSEFFAAIMPVLFFSMLGDTADYSEWKNKRRATGLIYSAGTFINKTGSGFSGALILVVLGAFGYIGTDASTIHLALPALKSLMSWIPALFAFIAAALLLIYPLTQKHMDELEPELAAQRAAGEANT